MAEVTFDDPTLNWPQELNTVENEPFRRIVERIVARIGGPANDSINLLTESLDSQSTSITTLAEAIEEIEEIIALQKQNLDTSLNRLEILVKEIKELKETE